MKIIYKENDIKEFDMNKYLESLNRYGKVTKEQVEEGLNDFPYDPLHVSCLVELGVRLLPEEAARKYFDEHPIEGQNFERLARITGYLVGTLDRWNDAKRSEWKERVKHSVNEQYTPEGKTYLQMLKLENSIAAQV